MYKQTFPWEYPSESELGALLVSAIDLQAEGHGFKPTQTEKKKCS